MRLYLLTLAIALFMLADTVIADTISYSEMKQAFGKNKKFVTETELPALIALSFYPELKHTNIRFKYKAINTTMAARPTVYSIFSNRRTYIIYINNDVNKTGAVAYSDLNLIQQIGIIAHELAHVSDFENKNSISLIGTGILYKFFNSYHRNTERKTDQLVIEKGLGNELYAFTYYVLNNSKASPKYIDFKKKNYLLPEEIMQIMK